MNEYGKILVTGANGMLGRDLCPMLEDSGFEVIGTDINNLDITDEMQVMRIISSEKPDYVIHCAAYTNVDKAEDDLKTAALINAKGTENVAKACQENDSAMVYISVRPERYSYHMIKESGEFVINLTTEKLANAADYCGVRSGRQVDKWKECGLTADKAASLEYAPVISESPVNIECKVKEIQELGSHHMCLAEVTAVRVGLGKKLGTFGYSVKKKSAGARKKKAGAARRKSGGKENR